MPEHAPDPQVIPYLLYADASAAMDWLIKTFAFTEPDRAHATTVSRAVISSGRGVRAAR